jgi:hypothetical protein
VNHIDDLYQTIKPSEIIDMDAPLEDEKQQRIEQRIMSKLSYSKKKRFSKRKLFVLLIAATLFLGVTGYASERNNWDEVILDYMGISKADQVKLKDSEVDIGASSTNHGVTMTAVTSIGDKNASYIRIDTDYKLPVNFDSETDSITTKGFSCEITDKRNKFSSDNGCTFSYFDHNGYLSFMLYISDCKGINHKKVKLTLSDIYLYRYLGGDKTMDDGTMLVSGNWILTWQYHYPSNMDTYHPLKLVKSNGFNCILTKLEVSPITIRAEAIKSPFVGKTEKSMITISKITMKDGTVIHFLGNASAGCKNNTQLEAYQDVLAMGNAIDPSQIESVTIDNTDIKLRK